jgi:hypothetical protein
VACAVGDFVKVDNGDVSGVIWCGVFCGLGRRSILLFVAVRQCNRQTKNYYYRSHLLQHVAPSLSVPMKVRLPK